MTIELTIESLASGGAGVGRAEDGRAVFVNNTAPGDVISARVEADKESFLLARLERIIAPGQSRIEPQCPLAVVCGGCSWMQVDYAEQIAAKRSIVKDALVRIAHREPSQVEELVGACVPSKREVGYRNKLELACTRDDAGRLKVGLHAPASDDIIGIDTCPLAHKSAATLPKALQGALRYLEGDSDLGIFRIGVRASLRTKSLEIALWTKPGAFPRAAAAKTIKAACHATSIVRVIAEPGAERKVKNVEVLAGNGYWKELLGDDTFLVSAPSFFQVNTAQAEQLQRLVLEGLDVQEDDVVADLYAGVGTFSIPLALEAGSCIAVESSASAVRDLRRNAESAQVFVDVIGGDSAYELPQMGALDALVVDPPRAGLAKGVAESIAQAAPERLAYVSCDPATFARDVARLSECGYILRKATPVDLFPQTHHVETVGIFTRQ